MIFKPATPKADSVADLEAADAAFRTVADKRREVEQRIISMKTALAISRRPSDSARVPEELQEKASVYAADAARRPAKIENAIADAEFELARVNKEYMAAAEAWELARRRRTSEIAVQLQPQHQRALMAVVAAVEALSKAIAAERGVRNELRERGAPYRSSPFLPNFVDDLLIGELGEHGSPASKFAGRIREYIN